MCLLHFKVGQSETTSARVERGRHATFMLLWPLPPPPQFVMKTRSPLWSASKSTQWGQRSMPLPTGYKNYQTKSACARPNLSISCFHLPLLLNMIIKCNNILYHISHDDSYFVIKIISISSIFDKLSVNNKLVLCAKLKP